MPILAFLMACWGLGAGNAGTQTLTFEQVLEDGLENSFDKRIIHEEIQAARAEIEEARAGLYPRLTLRFGNEYVHVFDESSGVISVGDTIITGETSGYKNSLITTAQYSLFDFGAKEMRVEYARENAAISELRGRQARKNLKLTLLELYANGLKSQEQLRALSTIYTCRNQIYGMTKRLQQAGIVGHDTVGDAALLLAEAVGKLEEQRTAFHNLLEQLGFHTRQSYDPAVSELKELPSDEKPAVEIDVSGRLEIRILDKRILNKRLELTIAERSALPVFNLYGNWRQFGSDDSSYQDGLSDLTVRDASVTIFLEYPLFDGFKNKAVCRRLRHEINGLVQTREKKMAELLREFAEARNAYLASEKMAGHRRDRQELISGQTAYKRRLSESSQHDQITYYNQMIQMALRQKNLNIEKIESAAARIQLHLLQGEGA